jgi:hypothetical protein
MGDGHWLALGHGDRLLSLPVNLQFTPFKALAQSTHAFMQEHLPEDVHACSTAARPAHP